MNYKGILKIHCFENDTKLPISNVKISIIKSNNTLNDLDKITDVYTSDNGYVDNIVLETPAINLSYIPKTLPYGIYNIKLSKQGYKTLIIKNVQIFPKVTAIQDCYLEHGSSQLTTTIVIPEHKHVTNTNSMIQDGNHTNPNNYPINPYSPNRPTSPPNLTLREDTKTKQKKSKSSNKSSKRKTTRVLSEVLVPATITIHTGSPYDNSAPNYTVPFVDYIKNVACSELYATWNTNCLRANIYAIVSFALNRIYTEWYRSQGFDFDITNDTAFVI